MYEVNIHPLYNKKGFNLTRMLAASAYYYAFGYDKLDTKKTRIR